MQSSKKKIVIIVVGALIISILCPLIIEHSVFRNSIYSVIENKDCL